MRFSTSAPRAMAVCFVLCLSALPVVCQSQPVSSKGAQASQAPGVERIRNGVELTTGDLNVRVQFYSDGTVRVVKWPAGGTSEKSSLSVIQKGVPELSVRFEENAGAVTLSAREFKVLLSKSDGAIQYLANDDHVLLKEQGRAIFTPCPIEKEKAAFSVQQNFTLTPDEGVYGLGQHQSGYMNYRGRTVKLVQSNTDAVTPILVSTGGYGIFWDNYSKTIFDDNPRSDVVLVRSGRQHRLLLLFRPDHRPGHRRIPATHRAGSDVRQMGLRLLAEQRALRDPRRTARHRAGIPQAADSDR